VTEALLERARQLHARAVDEFGASHPARARALGRRAVALLEAAPADPARDELLARTLISLSGSAAELSGPAAGLELVDRAEALADRRDDRAIGFLARSQRGSLAIRSGDLAAAAAALRSARDYLDFAEPYDRTVVLGNSANVHLYLGELRLARPLLEAAIQSSIEADLPRDEAKARHNLGYLEFLDGDLPRALTQMIAALAIASDLPPGISLLDRARVLAEAGLVREADQSLAEAADLFRRDRLAQDLGETELERARCALIGGDAEAARRLAMRARDRFRRRGNDRWRRSAELVLLQGDLAAGRPGGRLAGPALRLREEFERDGVRLPAQTAALIAAEAHLSAGQPDAARPRWLASRGPLAATRSPPACTASTCGRGWTPTPAVRRRRHGAPAKRSTISPRTKRASAASTSPPLPLCTAAASPNSTWRSRCAPNGRRSCSPPPNAAARSRPGCRRCARRTTPSPPSCSPSCGRPSRRCGPSSSTRGLRAPAQEAAGTRGAHRRAQLDTHRRRRGARTGHPRRTGRRARRRDPRLVRQVGGPAACRCGRGTSGASGGARLG